MDSVIVLGVLSLGVLIGVLVGWYVNEAPKMTYAVVSASIAIFSGSGVIAIFHLISPAGPTREYWFYPVGLLIGLVAAAPLDVYFNKLYVRKRRGKTSISRRPK